jgi:hypothetical protein
MKADESGFVWAKIVVMKRLKYYPHLFPVIPILISLIRLAVGSSSVSTSLRQIGLFLSPASGESVILQPSQMETTLFR